MPKISVLLADDHAIVSQGLASLLSKAFLLLGSVTDGSALVAAVSELKPDVVITDISMPGLNGMEAIRQIRKLLPATKIVVLTMHADPVLVAEAVEAGASGYVSKVSALDELLRAIHTVVLGQRYISPQLPGIIAMAPAESSNPGHGDRPLTTRQTEVLQLIAEGRTMKEVASKLGISPRTAESHKYYMMHALGCKTTADLVRHAVKLHLVPH